MSQPVKKSRNAAATRSTILEAARTRFLLEGYDQAGLRAIATDAGVDPALIFRYFGSKEALFAEVLTTTGQDPMEVLAGDRASFGVRVARAMLEPERHPERMAFIALATRSSTSPIARKLVLAHIEKRFVAPFAASLGGRGATEKAWLAASVLMGVAVMAGIKKTPPAGDKRCSGVERLARVLQDIVDGT